jgi:beta-lactamase class A
VYDRPRQLLRVWLGEGLNRPPPPVEIPLRYSLDRDALDNWLGDVARQYDRPPTPPQPIPAMLQIAPGQPGRQLDLAVSRERAITALTNPQIRTANLVVREAAPPPVDTGILTQLLQTIAGESSGIVSVFLHQTRTGDEVALNADVAYPGMSTMKVAILVELYMKLTAPPDAVTSQLIEDMISKSSNVPANELLAIIGDGDAGAGVKRLNTSLNRLGLKNTFMSAPYDQPAPGPHIRTESNSRTDLSTHPDADVQTTARDIGLMLEMLVACGQGGGTLLAAYPDEITQAECQQALEFMKLNEVTDLIVSGLPENTRAVHKHGYVADTHGDVAAIWGPAGPYVLSVFIYQPPWLEWSASSQMMGNLSKAIWNYFASAQQP